MASCIIKSQKKEDKTSVCSNGKNGTLFAVFLLLDIDYTLCDVGTALSYDPPYTPTKCNGNRDDQFSSGNLFVSVSEGLWDNGAACGRRYRLKCLSGNNKPCRDGTIDVMVVDYCPKRPCPSTILLSNDAFSKLSRSQSAKINVKYVRRNRVMVSTNKNMTHGGRGEIDC